MTNPASISSYLLMVNMQIHGIILLNVGSPEVVRVKATLGRLLTALPSEKIYSPLHIHIAPELLIPQDQATHALCVFCSFSLDLLCFLFNLVIMFMPDEVLSWGVECKSFLPVRVGHPKIFPCKQVL